MKNLSSTILDRNSKKMFELMLMKPNRRFITLYSTFYRPDNLMRFSLRVLLTLIISNFYLFAQTIHFEQLNTSNGLSNNNVYDILQDNTGFIWFATDDGLNRFDGYNFKVFRNDPKNRNSLSDNSIRSLKQSKDGKIWIGTKSGMLNSYDPVSEKFEKWEIKSELIKENTITTIYSDKNNFIWIGTYRSGLYRLNPSNGKIDNWQYDPDDINSLSYNYVLAILEDDAGNFWISTYHGLNKFNPDYSPSKFIKYYKDQNTPNTLSDNILWNLSRSENDKNIMWIGTAAGLTSYNFDTEEFKRIEIPNPENLQFGTGTGEVIEEKAGKELFFWIDSYAGLLRYNLISGKCERLLHERNNPFSIPSNRINKIYRDNSDVMWVATDNGIAYLSPKHKKFNYAASEDFSFLNSKELYRLSINALVKTSNGTLWIGTEKGIFHTELKEGTTVIKKLPVLSNVNVWSLSPGNKNDLWIGTYGNGFYQLNSVTKNITDWTLIDKRTPVASKYFIKSILNCSGGSIWIGYWGLGLANLDLQKLKFNTWLYAIKDSNSISHNDVWVLFQDSKNRIWIGTNGGGLNLVTGENTKRFIRWISDDNNNSGLSSNSIYSICEAKYFPSVFENQTDSSRDETVLWIGTNNGLNKFVITNPSEDNPENLEVQIKRFTIADGLADNSVKSIVEDESGKLWLGTSSGISLFDPSLSKFINFTEEDGIDGKDFNLLSALAIGDGYILMGSKAGLNYFRPADIRLSEYEPNIVITDFQIFNKTVIAGDASLIKSSISFVEEITIPYSDNVFSFEYAALDFASSSSIQYAYKMENFDNDWIYGGNRRFVTYTNLNPGEYIFMVKSTNHDGIWCENTKAVKVIITPPWWQTYWAMILYFIILILGVLGIIKFQIYRNRLQDNLKLREFEAHHLREVEKMKSRFFENLSHEFRTPLTLIKGPLEQLLSGKVKENLSDYYRLILRNTEKLQGLIDELLELSKLESESIPINKQQLELTGLLRKFTYSFMPLAEQNKIELKFYSNTDLLFIDTDRDKLEKIVNNLLSNAFKFTPAGGAVTVELSLVLEGEQNNAIIKVKDTGTGIPEEHHSKIFNRFHKVESNRNYGGFGIGLSLVKELITLLGWNISVSSQMGSGSEFIISIPLPENFENVNQAQTELQEHNHNVKENGNGVTAPIYDQLNENETANKQTVGKHIILIVEDSPDVRVYVADLLKNEYEILLAENGEKGLELALDNIPDLILSDIMMPGMDGIEFCRRIKTSWQTSHIPIILLTAKVGDESKLEGLETGADDYLTKPFNADELLVRIKNLIEQRKHLREKFSKDLNLQPVSLAVNSTDKKFIQSMLEVIEKNISNNKFDLQVLAEELFIGKRQLQRKVTALTGNGPGEFIRTVRLKKAADLILENKLSITQIAYEIGFESPAQFTRAFKKLFNILPSDFRANSARK